jgi:hypothetical protein
MKRLNPLTIVTNTLKKLQKNTKYLKKYRIQQKVRGLVTNRRRKMKDTEIEKYGTRCGECKYFGNIPTPHDSKLGACYYFNFHTAPQVVSDYSCTVQDDDERLCVTWEPIA